MIQTSCRRCPNCRSYDIDYLDWGTPVLPKKHIPHETGDIFMYKRVNPLFPKWRYALQSGDLDSAHYLMTQAGLLLKRAEHLGVSAVTIAEAKSTWNELARQTIDARTAYVERLEEELRQLRQKRLLGY